MSQKNTNETALDNRNVEQHAQDFSQKPIEPEEKPSGNKAGVDAGLWSGGPLPD